MSAGRTAKNGVAPESYLPLKPVWFHILMTLAGGSRHGYAIRQEVQERTDGALRLWPTTLYGALSQLEAEGLIVETEDAAGPDDDVQRRFYRITPAGSAVLVAETDRLAELVRLSRAVQRRRPREA